MLQILVTASIMIFLSSFCHFVQTQRASSIYKISIGFVYCEPEELLRAEEVVFQINKEKDNLQQKVSLIIEIKPYKITSNDNTISLSLAVCDKLMGNEPLYAVVTAKTNCIKVNSTSDYILSISAIGFTCAYYQIPVVDLYSGEAEFSDRSIFGSFLRMSPPHFHQVSVWIDIMMKCKWHSANLIHSQEAEGRMFATRFQYLADQHDIKIANEIDYMADSDTESYKLIIDKLIKSTAKVFLLQAKIKDAEIILHLAQENDLMTAGNVWIVDNNILENLNFISYKQGILLAQYVEDFDLVYHGFSVLKRAIESLNSAGSLKKPAANCNENGLEWDQGRRIYDAISEGKEFEFDEEGDRLTTRYNILNVAAHNGVVKVGEVKYDSRSALVDLNITKIVWPGISYQKPDGTKWSNKFRIVTIEEKPFVFKIQKQPNKECYKIQNNSVDCSWSHDNITENFCCFGYCIDMIRLLSEQLGFEYEIYLVPDGVYGILEKQSWNGLMGELLSERADMILAPFTINPERATYVDFTKPFKYQGITILVKRKETESSLVSFLQPFKDGLWVMVLLSVHVVALVLYLLDRFSPFGRFKLSKTENTEEDALNLSRSLWFTWGVLLNSGIGEGTPRSFSARVLGMVWAGFAMIMVASYTANLAAFLVLDRPEASITGINDARLRNPSDNYTYATVRGSAVERYFKRQVELSTMFRTMEGKNYKTVDEAIFALKTGSIQAFIWDSVRLEYEARKSCEFITTGELFGRSSYALALKKGNPWLSKLSMQILSLHENGSMEDLDKEWILLNNTSCVHRDSSPSTLGLTNMAGVFMLVAGGIIVGIFLIFVEIAYKKRKDKKVREHDLSRNAFATWRKNVEKRKLRNTRDSIDFSPKQSVANLSPPSKLLQLNNKTISSNISESNTNFNLKPIISKPANLRLQNENSVKITPGASGISSHIQSINETELNAENNRLRPKNTTNTINKGPVNRKLVKTARISD